MIADPETFTYSRMSHAFEVAMARGKQFPNITHVEAINDEFGCNDEILELPIGFAVTDSDDLVSPYSI